MERATLLFACLLLFTTANSQWQQVGQDIDGVDASDFAGHAMKMSNNGKTLIIGAEYNDDGGVNTGHTRVFTSNGNKWIQKGQTIVGENPGDHDGFSTDVSDDGNIIAISSFSHGEGKGRVRAFQWDGTTWIPMGSSIDGVSGMEHYGKTISLNSAGNILAIGSYHRVGTFTRSGLVQVYNWDGASWNQLGNDFISYEDGGTMGLSVSLDSSGSRIAIGSLPAVDIHSNDERIEVHEWDGSTWNQLGSGLNQELYDDLIAFRVSLSADGQTLATCSYQHNDRKGLTRVFTWDGSNWNQKGKDITGENAGSWGGFSAALSHDGNVLAIGDVKHKSSGKRSGRAHVYSWNGKKWVSVGQKIQGEDEGDWFGYQIALSDDGRRVAVSGKNNGSNGRNSGHVRVFDFNGEIKTADCSLDDQLQIFPNPVIDELTINVDELEEDWTITVTDMVGKIVERHQISEVPNRTLSFNHAPGIYILRIETESGCTGTIKVFKEWP